MSNLLKVSNFAAQEVCTMHILPTINNEKIYLLLINMPILVAICS